MWEYERVISCPTCGRAADARIFGIFTGFGPEKLKCPNCDGVFESGRTEWIHLTGKGRVRFWALTFLYLVVLGTTGAAISQLYYDVWNRRPKLAEHYTLRECVPGAVLLFLFGAVLQFHRIRCSIRRTQAEEEFPVSASFWNLQISVQNKVRALLILVILGGVLGLVLYRLGPGSVTR